MARPEKLTLKEILQAYRPQLPMVVMYWPKREIWMGTKVDGDTAYGFRPGRIYEPMDQKMSLEGERGWGWRG